MCPIGIITVDNFAKEAAGKSPPLPIDAALPALTAALRARNVAVLVAPPGAGKTTRVPLALGGEPWAADRRILVLEPRRIAARAAAARMARTLGEDIGETVGLRVRFGSKTSRRTRIEIVTEGIFTRLVLDDPMLEDVAAVLFDEFHERSLDADLGLAFARDVQKGLREDLRLLVMSATIDGARVSKLLDDAPVIAAEGRAFPVETRYLGRDARPIEPQLAEAIRGATRTNSGSVLAFLPGAAEIRRTASLLDGALDPATDLVTLYGALAGEAQDRAIAPAPPGRRKIVLATSIAETSITIEGVRIVVDSGLARVPRYEPDVGVTRLETVRVSRAAADQRRGRAGRLESGICYRMWDEPQTASLEPYTRPEILSADLSSFALDLAAWGSRPEQLSFLDPPPAPALKEAYALLRELGAVDNDGRITDAGRKLRRLPLPPRLSRMVVDAAARRASLAAAEIAVLIGERGLGGDDVDLTARLDSFHRDRSGRAREARAMAARWAELAQSKDAQPAQRTPFPVVGDGSTGKSRPALPLPHKAGGNSPSEPRAESAGALLALAFPERIAKNRGAGAGSFVLANGRGAQIDPASALAREPYLAVAELAGSAAAGRILLAAPISPGEIEARFADRIETREEISFDAASASLRQRGVRRLGAIALAEQPMPVEPSDNAARLLAEGIARLGVERLPWTRALRQWRDRVMFLRQAEGNIWPDLSDPALAAEMDWLTGLFAGKTSLAALSADEFADALTSRLPFPLHRRLEAEAPTHFTAPTGSQVPIDYEADGGPKISIRVQELFGLGRHPAIAAGKIALLVELLSPAHRPVQMTRDLPGFWRGSYAAVRAEMRGRYPKHPWPDDPMTALPTRRANRRK
ncbi:MAG: ATP-dependent helicase HrpB [Hyphomicrobiales bacterium]|nr:ATP-dependent helicase HrpB [Hyphomicrobiales bacterium]